MAKPHAYVAGDYAGVSSANASFYYGYEVTDANGDNCFTATLKENGEETTITIPYSELGTRAEMWQCPECLLQCIALVLDKYRLVS